jgi:hypothetical protein
MKSGSDNRLSIEEKMALECSVSLEPIFNLKENGVGVIAEDGKIYKKESLQEWLLINDTSPTKSRRSAPAISPSFRLRRGFGWW